MDGARLGGVVRVVAPSAPGMHRRPGAQPGRKRSRERGGRTGRDRFLRAFSLAGVRPGCRARCRRRPRRPRISSEAIVIGSGAIKSRTVNMRPPRFPGRAPDPISAGRLIMRRRSAIVCRAAADVAVEYVPQGRAARGPGRGVRAGISGRGGAEDLRGTRGDPSAQLGAVPSLLLASGLVELMHARTASPPSRPIGPAPVPWTGE